MRKHRIDLDDDLLAALRELLEACGCNDEAYGFDAEYGNPLLAVYDDDLGRLYALLPEPEGKAKRDKRYLMRRAYLKGATMRVGGRTKMLRRGIVPPDV